MKTNYTIILAGTLLTIWQFQIRNVELFNSAAGYFLILLGIMREEKRLALKEYRYASRLAIALGALELLYLILVGWLRPGNFGLLALANARLALPPLLFYYLIKADYLWKPRRRTRLYLQVFFFTGAAYIILLLFATLSPLAGVLFIVGSALYLTLLFYTLLQLRQLA